MLTKTYVNINDYCMCVSFVNNEFVYIKPSPVLYVIYVTSAIRVCPIESVFT